MLLNESLWLQQKLTVYIRGRETVLNMGSSSLSFRTIRQSHIHANVIAPLETRAVHVIHVDMKDEVGVDQSGDVTDPIFVEQLRAHKPTAIICSNLLEHLTHRASFCTAVSKLLLPGGLIFATCPHEYPYHPDPIDTMYRPSVLELASEFPGTQLLEGDIVPCGLWGEKIAADLRRQGKSLHAYRIKRLIRLMLPFYRPRSWWLEFSGKSRFPSNHPISATCVVLRKTETLTP